MMKMLGIHKKVKGKGLRSTLSTLTLASLLLFLPQGIEPLGEKAEADQSQPAASSKKTPLTSAYVFDRAGLTFAKADGAKLDQLNYSFGLIKNGRVSGSHWKSIDSFKAFIAANPHIRPVLSIGGWGADGFSQAASTEKGRQTFVDSTLELMEAHGFMGVDIDWEYPCSSAAGIASSPEDKENFTLLLQAMRKGLDGLTAKDGKDRILCFAIGCDDALLAKIDCAAVGRIVDQVNLMSYDMQVKTTTTHHTNLYTSHSDFGASADSAVAMYAKAGIPKSKMVVGCAFYGRTLKTASKANNGLYQKATGKVNKTYTYADIKAMLSKGTTTRYYDEKAQAPYLFDGSVFTSYDDPQSIGQKGAYVKANGLMGLMCWEYGGDADGELLGAMHDSLQ